ncbi:hypothetical protein [Aliidiomarina soli]|uniref:Lipoprotein n=1 Tax=Aliidiomarina soli TaxID=1928574 RepID=A0A432WDC0_9GAMM|nr:hypothetical protein [Aliidiomarina soli]RUO30388.1 hypothetical protein CWE14_13570 [Aliidiomarina soli]
MKKLLFGAPIILALTGCVSDTDFVKNGTMDFNGTITVGEALDSWKSCERREWEEFETDNGVQVVQFSCQHKIDQFISRTKSLLPENELEDADHLDIDSNLQIFQFTINRDQTFQIDNVQIRTTWADGTSFEDSQEPVEQLQTAYANQLNFDPNELDSAAAAQTAYVFMVIKSRAN